MKAPDKVKRLVEVFDRNLEAYKSSGYKEANVRSEFLASHVSGQLLDVRP